ncbi:hypothetical protein pEaSNUABM40_00313 [Erwinia phage pEa_SNUABM_40]|uniref:Uncharacterized protein n=1 Tax=Erwinia phage pEa_SNUABM_3 TaxID=2869552 RepID=A0AAE7XJ43_9CAUD|nr:hypothetical protein MPK68_gp311 [Erwinia phage pEa_SNUABM_3]QZE56845.1 hypothetical protein pEaSNUABM20_00309 [Erwinia phage pEa_SNUABM_20]QZE58529.1 hypothetical protein pEaSNUABM40_00313 [Erwinia phage pEa_SNUABM_40]UAW53090.1 hypothetical protein pEaSNUABM23_00308 [Erwinia phage pEa_SNUABM_23]UIW10985.1 hypothetical protein pEaSNUABM23_00308 [Erwinia phage pEa_SNUABM_31]QZE56508.1 hypothetical protein pEaSNUABM3_00311 [Erwinia phage pEa_SNUABM_3]
MEQIDLFDTKGAHEISEYIELGSDGLPLMLATRNDWRVYAAFGDPVVRAELLEKHPDLKPGKLKFRKKLVMIQEFVLVTHDTLKESLRKKQGDVYSGSYDRDPQYLINVYNHTEKVALFMRDFEDFMSGFMNAVHLFTVSTVYDGRLLIFAENGAPIVSAEETLEMLNEIEHFINRSKVYRVHSQHAIYRTI